MPLVEVFDRENALQPLFVAEFSFLPRPGEYLSQDAGGYFQYYNVLEVWHRQDTANAPFQACIRVRLSD